MPDLPTSVGSSYAPTINSTTLTVDLNSDDDRLDVTDGTGFQRGGGLVLIDTEVIYYGTFDSSEPNTVYDLKREMNGTVKANHAAGKSVTIFSYGNMLALQAHILNLEQRMQDAGF